MVVEDLEEEVDEPQPKELTFDLNMDDIMEKLDNVQRFKNKQKLPFEVEKPKVLEVDNFDLGFDDFEDFDKEEKVDKEVEENYVEP